MLQNKLPAVIVACLCVLTFAVALLVVEPGEVLRPAPSDAEMIRVASQAAPLEETDTLGTLPREELQLAPPAEAQRPSKAAALAQVDDDFVAYAELSLDGAMFVNDVLDRMLEYASLPLSAHPDLDYEDNDALAYRLHGTPDGTEARVLTALEPYYEDGRTFSYLQLRVQVDADSSEYDRGAIREGPYVGVSISYDVNDPERPTRFALMVKHCVSLSKSRDAGIDAYSGRYTDGAYFWVDLLKDPHNPTSGTFGLIDGQHTGSVQEFDGVHPLAGDLQLDPERLAALLKQLHAHLSTIKGE